MVNISLVLAPRLGEPGVLGGMCVLERLGILREADEDGSDSTANDTERDLAHGKSAR